MFIKRNYLIGAAIIFLIGAFFVPETILNKVGSVSRSSEYKYLNIKDVTGSSTTGVLLKTGPATIGSLTLATATAQKITIYDVASAANFASTTLSTKVIEFATSTAAGTYTIDASVYKGLVIQGYTTPTTEGVITYR